MDFGVIPSITYVALMIIQEDESTFVEYPEGLGATSIVLVDFWKSPGKLERGLEHSE